MISKWQHLSLREAGISLIDCVHKTPEAKDDGYPYVAIPQMKDGRIDLSSARKISHEDFLAWTVKAKPKANDVVLSRRCNPGESACVPEGVEFALGQNLVLLRSDGKKVHKPYLRWLLNSPFWWAEIQKFMNVGAVFTSLKCADVLKFTLPIPPLDEQEKISEILSSIDTKIELNRQINQTLEALAQAIFRSWFMDFEPVKAKISAIEAGEDAERVTRAAMSAISGKTDEELDQLRAEHPEHYTQIKTTAEIFPSTIQDSELGKIPKGWKAGCFGDVIVQCRRRIQARSAVVLSAVASGQLVLSDEHFTKKVYSESIEKYLAVEKWDFAYNPSRINIGSIGMHKKDELGAVSPVYVVFRPGADYRWFIEVSLKLSKTKNWINTLASGSVRQSLSFNDFASIPAIIPSKGCISMFNLLCESLEAIIEAQINEINTLTSLRDTLLPKLLSGELSIDAAEFAEED